MKRVTMNVSISSSEDWSYYPGQEVELEDTLADQWQEVGHCTIIQVELKKEGATDAVESK